MKIQAVFLALVSLTACADPLRNVARLDEITLSPDALTVAAMPGADESADAPPVLGQLLAQSQQAGNGTGSSAATSFATIGPNTPPRQGFWALFAQPQAAILPVAAGLSTQDAVEPGTPTPEIATDTPAVAGPEILDDIPLDAPSVATTIQGDLGQISSPSPPANAPQVAASNTQPAPGLSPGPDARQVAPGTLLPYGQIATVCGQPEASLGTRVATAAGYALYDSEPSSTAVRAQYLTGFADGCARIFSAALVLFGDVGTHEAIRYLPSNASMAYSGTDTAYEQVKAQVCAVSAGQPCGRNIDRLATHSTFVTIYETFGTNAEWGEIFVHQGQVMAIDVRRG